ncbi:metal binding domain of Ada-domain-containing protein, partial [Coniochaeta sp. 2T2.1]
WKAVKEKDASADGNFVYAVRTTKIYCRPVCRARLPREANVAFYDTAAEAERAGYRSCKRCKPDLAGQVPENHAVRRVRAMVAKEFPSNGGLGLAEMARQAGLSKWHFHRVFKEVTSMTPTEYV